MKKVLEIIDEVEYTQRHKYLPPTDRQKISAKLIHKHYMKFVEWFLWQDEIGTEGTTMDDNGILKVFDDSNTERTIEEVYQYYCENVLNKDNGKG